MLRNSVVYSRCMGGGDVVVTTFSVSPTAPIGDVVTVVMLARSAPSSSERAPFMACIGSVCTGDLSGAGGRLASSCCAERRDTTVPSGRQPGHFYSRPESCTVQPTCAAAMLQQAGTLPKRAPRDHGYSPSDPVYIRIR